MLHKTLWEIDEMSDDEYNLWMGWFAIKEEEQKKAAKKSKKRSG